MKLRARLPLWCSVPAGVLGAHAVTYLTAYPDEQRRNAFLAITGHTYLRHAVLVAVIGAAVALTLSVARGLAGATTPRWWDAALRVSALQTAAFVAVEMLERVAVGLRPTSGLARVALVGIGVQIAMGAIVAFVLAVAHRAGRTIGALIRREIVPAVTGFETSARTASSGARPQLLVLAHAARAPPLPPR